MAYRLRYSLDGWYGWRVRVEVWSHVYGPVHRHKFMTQVQFIFNRESLVHFSNGLGYSLVNGPRNRSVFGPRQVANFPVYSMVLLSRVHTGLWSRLQFIL